MTTPPTSNNDRHRSPRREVPDATNGTKSVLGPIRVRSRANGSESDVTIRRPLQESSDWHPINDEDDSLSAGHDESEIFADLELMEETAGADDDEQDWYESDIAQQIAQRGSAAPAGNRMMAIPLWVIQYFRTSEKSLLFAQVLYWFGRSAEGMPRLGFRDQRRRHVLAKTHRDLAREIGVKNPRRIGKLLDEFERAGLLEHYARGIGAGKRTWIRLLPAGVRRAYETGCARVRRMELGEDP